jgi:hypothetical protein
VWSDGRNISGKIFPQYFPADELLDGQTANERPDLVTRVFEQKLKELHDDIFNKRMFGRVLAYIQCVEFQKRGNPHAHILVTLEKVS